MTYEQATQDYMGALASQQEWGGLDPPWADAAACKALKSAAADAPPSPRRHLLCTWLAPLLLDLLLLIVLRDAGVLQPALEVEESC